MPGNKILIIDDDNKNIFALTATLRVRKFQTLSALNAKDGIKLIEHDPAIGIVLMDMMMPDMDGYEAIRMIRKSEYGKLPLIAVTAQAMIGDKEKCLQAGADGYISKPINVDALLLVLDKYVKGG
jgi:two-component system cell cycle response regulator DivK